MKVESKYIIAEILRQISHVQIPASEFEKVKGLLTLYSSKLKFQRYPDSRSPHFETRPTTTYKLKGLKKMKSCFQNTLLSLRTLWL